MAKDILDSARENMYSGFSVSVQPAPLGRRILAYATDMALVSVVLYVLFIVFSVVFVALAVGFAGMLKSMFAQISQENAKWSMFMLAGLLALGMIVLFLPFHFYFIWSEANKGTTLGKKLFGLRVISLKGDKVTWGQATQRELFRSYFDVLLIFPGIVSILLTEKRQRLGDILSSTRVVFSKSEEEENSFVYLKGDDYYRALELIKPKEMTRQQMEQFLAFAHATFINGHQSSETEMKQWEQALQVYVSLEGVQIDSLSFLKFMAEHCLIHLNKLNQDKVKSKISKGA